jgi:hypothetical protein
MATNSPDLALSRMLRPKARNEDLLPARYDEDGKVQFCKNGRWHAGGKCPNCDDVGPACCACDACFPRGYLYLTEHPGIELVSDPRKVGLMSQLIQSALAAEPQPHASRAHLLLLLDSLWSDYKASETEE